MKPAESSLPLFRRIFRSEWKLTAGITLLSLLVWLAAALSPWLQKQLIDTINQRDAGTVVHWAAAVAAVLLLLKVGELAQGYWSSLMAIRLEARMKNDFFSHLLHLPVSVLHSGGAGYYGVRFLHDIGAVNQFCASGVFSLLTAILKALGAAVFCCLLDWRLGCGILPVLALFVFLTWRSRRRLYQLNREMFEEAAGNRRLLQNALDRATLLKTGNREEAVSGRVRAGIDRLAGLKRLLLRKENLLQGGLMLIPYLCVGVTAVWGIRLIFAGSWTLGDLWAYISYLFLVFHPARLACGQFIRAQQAVVAGERLSELLALEPEEGGRAGIAPEHLRGEIEFRNVGFAHPGSARILDGIDLRIGAGEFVGLAGESGSGKTTLVSLLLRLNRPDSGVILLDGIPLEEYELGALRRRLGYLDQKTELLYGTLRENLQPPDRSLSDAGIFEVLDKVGLGGLIRSLPGGLDTGVHENSGNFSGGELLRLAMARELLREADLYIFDEATANLDAATEQRIVSLIRRELGGRTVLFISHRASTLDAADRVIRLNS